MELNSPLQASEARAATLLAKVENKSWQKAGLQQQLRVAVACTADRVKELKAAEHEASTAHQQAQVSR